MKYRNYVVYAASTVVLLCLSTFAKNKDQAKISLPDAVEIGSTHLQPGDYKVEWNGSGDHVTLNILQDGKTVATAPARWVKIATPSPYTSVTLSPMNGQTQTKRLAEIDLNHRTQALVLQ